MVTVTDWITLENCQVLGTTEKAVLVEDHHSNFWVPRSVLQDGDMLEKGDTDLVIAEWFARKNGIGT